MNTLLIQRGMKPDYLPEIASPARASRDARRAAASAFTLVELLAVLAIIGILSAIIIPTVSKVRESARNAQCISNLR
ncbi:MAG: prepilin-type N-terminal cleavage/methylation domain-containing protein, partial [Opitutaceae bacterium]|nr:prepilin-type N-terminal cleavage/methylation domain-containing protein [Opitutaceae bacterium]